MIAMVDDVTRDAALEAIIAEVLALADEDARAGRDMRRLEGPMAEWQDEYNEAFSAAIAARALN